jgi:hypothetical protein
LLEENEKLATINAASFRLFMFFKDPLLFLSRLGREQERFPFYERMKDGW